MNRPISAAVALEELPVAVFAYKRPQLLSRTLDCLRAAGFSRLYVFSDGPRGSGEEEAVRGVRELVRTLDWMRPTLIERETNVGVTVSVTEGLEWLFDRHERAVVIEEDILVAPEFGRFVARALDEYATEHQVAGVTGLRLPFRRFAIDRYPYDAFLLPRFSSHGWATWRRAWETFEFDHDVLLDRLRSSRARLEMAGADVPYMVRTGLIERTLTEPWDVCCTASMVLNDQYFVVPAWNMVENIGFATGLHAVRPGWSLRWETERRPDLDRLRLPPVEVSRWILKSYRIFRENPQGWTWRRLIPRPLRMLARRARGTYRI